MVRADLKFVEKGINIFNNLKFWQWKNEFCSFFHNFFSLLNFFLNAMVKLNNNLVYKTLKELEIIFIFVPGVYKLNFLLFLSAVKSINLLSILKY